METQYHLPHLYHNVYINTVHAAAMEAVVDSVGIEGATDDGLYSACPYVPSGSQTIGDGCYRKVATVTNG
jgi:hypothetical protein